MSSRTDLYVLFTMDVELPTSQPGTSGPRTSDAGAQAVRDYHTILKPHGYPPTYFIHPELAQPQGTLFRALAAAGCGLGLHLHTTKFQTPRHDTELGGLTSAQQHEAIYNAAVMFEQGIGSRPTLFRPGCFSANDDTYTVLTDLGFAGGSVSIPGRIWPDRCCVWSGAYPYVHRGHATFRQQRGDLPFVDVPLSVDLTSPLLAHPVGFEHYPDLRPGGVYADDEPDPRDHRQLLHNILHRMAKDDPPIKTLVIDVHNDRNFVGDATHAAQHLRTVLKAIPHEAAGLGWHPVGTTLNDVVQRFNTA